MKKPRAENPAPDYPGLKKAGIAERAILTLNPDRGPVLRQWADEDRYICRMSRCEADLELAKDRLDAAEIAGDEEQIIRWLRQVRSYEAKLDSLAVLRAKPAASADRPVVIEGRAEKWRRLARPVASALASRSNSR